MVGCKTNWVVQKDPEGIHQDDTQVNKINPV
jgi:hypothetical protein